MSTPSTEEDYRALPLSKLHDLEGMSFELFGYLKEKELDDLCENGGLTLFEKTAFRRVWSEHPNRRRSHTAVFAPLQSSEYDAAPLTAQAGGDVSAGNEFCF